MSYDIYIQKRVESRWFPQNDETNEIRLDKQNRLLDGRQPSLTKHSISLGYPDSSPVLHIFAPSYSIILCVGA